MDFYKSNKIFSRMFNEEKREVFVLSEETRNTLERWELNESDALPKLMRMLHTAPAAEKGRIRRAIAELERKQKQEKRKSSREEDRGFYTIYREYGEGSDLAYDASMNSINPDLWYGSPTMGWAKDGVKTFVYVKYIDDIVMSEKSGYGYAHNMMLYDLWRKGEIDMSMLDPDLKDELEVDYDGEFWKMMNADFLEGDFIQGRTGPLPYDSTQEEVERLGAMCVAIWNDSVDRKILDKMMAAINRRIKKYTYDALFVPDSAK